MSEKPLSTRIFTINPGSTSTKLALFEGCNEVFREELKVDAKEVKNLPLMLDQLPYRKRDVSDFISCRGIDISSCDMIVCRGGSMNGINSGAYAVDEHVLTILRHAPRTQHASSMACFIGHDLAMQYGKLCILYDSPSASDADPIVHYTGIPGVKRWASDHCLNSRIVARECAERMGRKYEEVNIIVVHLGGGVTLSFHSGGVMVDAVSDDECHMSPQRAGRIPSTALIEMCYSGKYTKQEMLRMMRGEGGLTAYLGVQDTREIEDMINQGNTSARELYEYMAYQICKSVGEMAVVRSGNIDRIVLTGGIAYSEMLTTLIKERISFLAPVEIIPGEREMLALAMGGMRVLSGEEPVKKYRWLPKDCSSLEDVIARYSPGDISTEY